VQILFLLNRHNLLSQSFASLKSNNWLLINHSSSLFRDLEAAHDAVAATDGEGLAAIAEVYGEARSTEIVDPVAWLEE